MPAQVRDVLKANIVFVGLELLTKPTEVTEFSEALGVDPVLAEAGLILGISSGRAGTGRKIALQRDRINIELIPDRTVIEREYPEEGALDRLAEVVDHAVRHTALNGGKPRAFGYNFELVYDQTSGHPSFQYLGSRLFGNGGFALEDWNLVGGAGRLLFDSSDGRWTIQVEPRHNDEETTRVFMNVNLHKTEQRVPDLSELKMTFAQVRERAYAFVAHLDEKVQ